MLGVAWTFCVPINGGLRVHSPGGGSPAAILVARHAWAGLKYGASLFASGRWPTGLAGLATGRLRRMGSLLQPISKVFTRWRVNSKALSPVSTRERSESSYVSATTGS